MLGRLRQRLAEQPTAPRAAIVKIHQSHLTPICALKAMIWDRSVGGKVSIVL
jgi:hypothetical protein